MARFDSLEDWLQWQEQSHPRKIDLGIERAANVYSVLNPGRVKPPTITVAGTNGKGSCIAFLESIYLAQGYKVGAYTSPHILKYNERIRINGQPVADQVICEAFCRIDQARQDVSLSYFEFGTLAALDIFWQSELDIQLLEVGLGGRLDAVNIIDADVALVTSICIDHIDWLGETREAIGFEKAGVFRKGKTAIIGDLDPPNSLLDYAHEIGANTKRINQDFYYEVNEHDWNWETISGSIFHSLPSPGLKGGHQYRNASSVLMAIAEMACQLPVSTEAIHHGLQAIHLSGRFQYVKSTPPVLLDVAHNPQAVSVLAEFLSDHFADKNIIAVFSMMKDKDIKGVIEIIRPLIDYWFFAPLNNPRTISALQIEQIFKQIGLNNISCQHQDFNDAFYAAESRAKADDLILVFGSFFLVSEYLSQKGCVG